jgi:hypothetical protein
VKREDFLVDGIPEAYRVYDVDLSPSGRPLVVVGHQTQEDAPTYLRIGQTSIPLHEGSVSTYAPTGTLQFWDFARWVGDDAVLVACARMESEEEINGRLWDREGNPLADFSLGDGINEVLANDRWIISTYFDEGVYSDIGPGHEGVAFFDSKGEFRFGYRTALGADAVHVDDCYAACWADSNGIIFLPYVDFPLVRLRIDTRAQETWPTPKEVHGSGAITSAGDSIFFYSPYDSPSYPTGRGSRIFSWDVGSSQASLAGEHRREKGYRLRGLPGGRFISAKPDGYTILSFE